MGNHRPHYFTTTNDDRHYARCTCRWESLRFPSQQGAEDDWLSHMRHIEKVRAWLGTRTPSLKQQRDYFRTQATDPQTDPRWRSVWCQLADELDHRLNDQPHEPHPQLDFNRLNPE